MTSRERFEAWAKDNCVRTYKQPWVDEYFWPEAREALRVWQARDPEVRELVEALRECRDELHGYGELYDEATAMDLVAKTDRILAKHESGGE